MIYYGQELYHHGVKGQRWGIRRYQNEDGTLTPAGKERYSEENVSSNTKKKSNAKKIAIGAGIAALTISAVALYTYNPAVRNFVNTAASKAVSSMSKNVSAGKSYMTKAIKNAPSAAKKIAKDAVKGAKQGAIEGLKNAPKKVVKATVEGAAIIATTKILGSALGDKTINTVLGAYNAYNKKNKINIKASKGNQSSEGNQSSGGDDD